LVALSAARLSPDSALNLLRQRDWSPESTVAIVTGIVNATHKRTEDAATTIASQRATIDRLRGAVANYEEIYDMAPDGYELATESVAEIQIPVGSGFYRPAKWVRRLDDGRVACFHDGQGPKDTPYVADLYAPANYKEEHPLEPLEPWLRRVLAGSAPNYTILLDEVDKLWEWGYHAEVERYRKLDGECRALADRVELLRCDLETQQQRRHLCEGRLVASRLQEKVAHIANRFAPYSNVRRTEVKGAWRSIDRKGKGRANVDDDDE
jgi:hypothetical protein